MGSATVKAAELQKLGVDVDPKRLQDVESAIAKKLKVNKKVVEVEITGGGKLAKVTVDNLDPPDIKKAFK